MKVLDLFSGIGGFSLGLERAGFKTVAFCEIEPYCRAVLKKHWPDVPQYDDVRTLTAKRLAADGIRPDVICGGFPCQDISVAGKGAGIGGERSGLWKEYARLVGELRPRYVIVENVAALLGRGMGVVLGDLAEIGYDAEWHCISAADVGAKHLRERIWIVAYPASNGFNGGEVAGCLPQVDERATQRPKKTERIEGCGGLWVDVADSDSKHGKWRPESQQPVCDFWKAWSEYSRCRSDVSNPGGPELDRWAGWSCEWEREPTQALRDVWEGRREKAWMSIPERELGRVADGIPNNVERLGALGNAVVPQIPEIIGRAIMQAEGIA